ncbi:MAG: tetratricopeptide repeat protein, partial [Polyangiaceae bacterium]
NVMATVDVALNMADSEPSPITPSIPAAAASMRPPPGELSSGTHPGLQATAPATAQAHEDAAPKGRIGVSRSAALFLVALAALQGLIVVGLLSVFLKPHQSTKSAPSASVSKSLPGGFTSSPDGPPPSVTPVAGTPTPAAAEKAQSALAVKEPPQGLAAATDKTTAVDESGQRAPSCQRSLGATAVHAGDYPGAAYGAMQEANRALVRGDVDASQRALCKAALWNQSNPAIPFELAQLLLLRRDGGQAVEWANKGLALDASSQRGQGILGDGLARVGQYDQAKVAWLKSMRLDPSSDPQQFKALSFSSLREAQASMKRRDFARAERFFRRAVVLDGDNGLASNGLADVLLKLGDTTSALRWANHSIAVAPRDARARVVLGDVLFQKGDRNAAEVEWREALQLEPANYQGKLRLNRLNATR